MPLVRPRVHRNSVCTKTLSVNSGFHYIGIVAATAVAQGGYFIDIDGELCLHGSKLVVFSKNKGMDTASGIFWVLLIFGLIWLVVLISVFINLSRRSEMSLIAKVFWIIVILSFPLLGLIIYLLVGRKKVVED
jgi:hypothetical protein